jgi:hypothetical protein
MSRRPTPARLIMQFAMPLAAIIAALGIMVIVVEGMQG